MTDIALTQYHVEQLILKLHVAAQMLERYSLDARVAHHERNAVEKTSIMIIDDVKRDLEKAVANYNGKVDINERDIPF